MPRPPTPPGELGKVSTRELAPTVDSRGRTVKRWEARARFRDRTGEYIHVQRLGPSATKAEKALRDAVDAQQIGAGGVLRPTSTVEAAALLYLRRVDKLVERNDRSGTTADRYRHLVEHVVVPMIGTLRLHECTPGRISLFFEQLAETRTRGGEFYSAHHRRNIRTVLRGIFQVAITHDAVAQNPCIGVGRIESDRRARQPRALTPHEFIDFFAWFDRADGNEEVRKARRIAVQRGLPDLLLLMMGAGLRIGEALALRWCDIELDGSMADSNGVMIPQPFLSVTGNIVRINGQGLVRNQGKTKKALRVVPLPSFVVAMLIARATRVPDRELTWPVFPSDLFGAKGAWWRSPEKAVHHIAQLREAMGPEWSWVVSHTMRKTGGTIWHEGLTPRVAADLIGHSQISTLQNVYVGRGGLHPQGAVVMEEAWTSALEAAARRRALDAAAHVEPEEDDQ